MYLPGSYLVYPSPIHLHHLPLPSTSPTPQQSQSTEDPSSTVPSFGLKNSLSPAFCDLLPPMEDSGSGRSPGPTAMDSESATTPFESTVHQQPSSSNMAISLPTLCRRSTPPALQSPPICRRSPPTVASRDLKFGVDRILSGELSLQRRPPSRKDSSARVHPDGEEISQVVRESSCNSNESIVRPNRIDSSPSSRILSSPSPPSSAPSSPVLPPNCPAVVAPCPRNALLLRCNGDYFGQTVSSFPAPYPSPSTRHPPPPHLDHTPLGCTTPATSSYAAYSGYYQQLHHHHHQGIISYTSLYTPGGSLLAPHLDEVGGPRCSSIGGACVPGVPSSGGGGSGVSGGGTSGGKRKRSWSRAVFSNLQRKGLEKRFQLQKYITKPDRRQLAATLGLTDAQVKVWFQNRRMKWRHSKEGKQSESPNSSIQAASSLHLSQEEDKTSNHSTPVGETTVNTEWNDTGRTLDGADSIVKGMEEEIRVDS